MSWMTIHILCINCIFRWEQVEEDGTKKSCVSSKFQHQKYKIEILKLLEMYM